MRTRSRLIRKLLDAATMDTPSTHSVTSHYSSARARGGVRWIECVIDPTHFQNRSLGRVESDLAGLRGDVEPYPLGIAEGDEVERPTRFRSDPGAYLDVLERQAQQQTSSTWFYGKLFGASSVALASDIPPEDRARWNR